MPRRDLARLRREVAARLGAAVLVEDLATSPRDPEAPLLMHNSRVARPFEPLVRFLDLPRAGSFDPTLVTTLFLPLMLGVMVGDVGYGAVLMLLAILARRSLAARTPALADLTWVALAGAAWTIVFGILFGELFGDLGKRIFGDFASGCIGPQPRRSSRSCCSLSRSAQRTWCSGPRSEPGKPPASPSIGRCSTSSGRCSRSAACSAWPAWAAGQLPPGALTPAVAATVVGLVLVMSLHGGLGLVTGPLEFMGTLGNVLSYLRLAAVGLASAHLAAVANELATVGPIWLGVFVAVFFHSLNLALARSARRSRRCVSITWSSSARSSSAAAARSAPSGTRRGKRPHPPRKGADMIATGLIAIGAGLAVGLSALATGYAQAKIGAAAMGLIAEKPELAGRAILLVAIPETLVILGFAVAAMTIVLL